MKPYVKKILLIISLLAFTYPVNAQFYVEGYGGVNTMTLKNDYNFTGNFGLGYNNKNIRIGVELGLSNGVSYTDKHDGGDGKGITFGDYEEGGTYGSAPSRQKILINPNGTIVEAYDNKNNLIIAKQLTFGAKAEWFIIKTFTDKVEWFDVGIFSGVGFGYYHSNYTVKYYQPYAKAGLSLNFNVKNVSFFAEGDVRYFSALNGKDKVTDIYRSYIQQCVGVGIRYTIPIKGNKPDVEPNVNIVINNNCQACPDTVKEVIRDTIFEKKIVMLPTSIFFLNDSYTIRKMEHRKLDKVIEFVKENDTRIKLIGMASKIGSTKHNQELSVNRCNAVKEYLINGGVKSCLIDTKPMGDTESEKYEEATDRCVVIVFE